MGLPCQTKPQPVCRLLNRCQSLFDRRIPQQNYHIVLPLRKPRAAVTRSNPASVYPHWLGCWVVELLTAIHNNIAGASGAHTGRGNTVMQHGRAHTHTLIVSFSHDRALAQLYMHMSPINPSDAVLCQLSPFCGCSCLALQLPLLLAWWLAWRLA